MRGWALVTGCSTGIGRSLVGALQARDWGVVATARRLASLDDLPEAANLRRLALDVTDPASLEAAAAACADLDLRVLVNNAGYGQPGPLEHLRPSELRAQLETNVVGLHAATTAFLPLLRRSGDARVVQVGSVLGRMSIPLAGAYCASKHAVTALAEALRLEVGPSVQVMLVEPGAIQSEFRETLARGLGDLPERLKGTPYLAPMEAYLARQKARAGAHGLSAGECAARIAEALGRPSMPRRLVIGRDARLANLGKALLPAPLWEWAVRKAFGVG
ncbi:MAG TPA: SDR family oxidoreductase [Holophaga sp.]|nr:SDR family oxidoreductase [Holophaga sp.]